MKIPYKIHCRGCNKDKYIFLSIDEHNFQRNCDCGYDLSGFFDSSVTTGIRLLYRSTYELMEIKDYCMSIVFSATAIECELSRLYFKWRDLDSIFQPERVTSDQLENDIRKFSSIDKKIDEIARLMFPNGISEFANHHVELRSTVTDGFPSLDINNLSKSFQQKLFWPRNRILHLAYTKYNYIDARRCYNIAKLGLMLLEKLDNYRQNAS